MRNRFFNVVAVFAVVMSTVVAGFAATASATDTCGGRSVTVDLSRGERPTSGPDVILGTRRADTIRGLGGNDTICGRGGNDTIFGGPGSDTIVGEYGSDTLHGGAGNDQLYGGAGRDTINGDAGADRIDGGGYHDALNGGSGRDLIYGKNGNDTINGGPGFDEVFGGNGNDTIHGQGGGDRLHGGNGDDTIRGGSGTDEIWGAAGNDRLLGENGSDTIFGGHGNDRLEGGGDVDSLFGQAGRDTLTGGPGAGDTLVGGAGSDTLYGMLSIDSAGVQVYDQLNRDPSDTVLGPTGPAALSTPTAHGPLRGNPVSVPIQPLTDAQITALIGDGFVRMAPAYNLPSGWIVVEALSSCRGGGVNFDGRTYFTDRLICISPGVTELTRAHEYAHAMAESLATRHQIEQIFGSEKAIVNGVEVTVGSELVVDCVTSQMGLGVIYVQIDPVTFPFSRCLSTEAQTFVNMVILELQR